MRMKWGKYKGFYLYELPEDYLWWLYGQDLSDPSLSKEIEGLARNLWPQKFVQTEVSVVRGITKEAVGRIYRKLANKWHPDAGGSTTAMQALNDFKSELLAQIDEV